MLNPNLKNLKENFAHFLAMNETDEEFINTCKTKAQESCIKIINKYIERIGKLIITTETLELAEQSNFKFTRENSIQTFELHTSLNQSLFDLYFQFLNFKFFYQANIPTTVSPNSLVKELGQTFNRFNFYILSNSDPRFFEAFSDYWNGFIKPVKSILLVEKDKAHFIRRMNDLNLRWNLLHVELTKRNKQVSKPVISLLTTMHNRWKICLRVTLR